ncbi:hypothetical protein ABH976_004330 [Bradyrhizobium ottawaense]
MIDKTPDYRGIVGVDHRLDADELGDDAAAVDVADQHDRHVGLARKTHIGDVGLTQIHLGRTAGAFHQH